jgi:ABC-type phosphate transport system substrate-binding protein
MHPRISAKILRAVAIACVAAMCAASAFAAFKNMAIVTSATSKVNDVPLADLVKFCKGATKTWPDGKNFSIVIKSPDAPELHGVLQKLFGATGSEAKAAIAKLNETRVVVKIVESDEELLKAVQATPGAVGVVDVYSINSSVKVLRIDGKLPFDVGYALKGN